MNHAVFDALAEAARTGEPVALGIISGVKGSSPQKIGAKALFYGDGRIKGTMGGGCLEAEIQKRALQSLRAGQPVMFDLLLDHDFGWDDGLICGGKVEGLIVPHAQKAGALFWTALAARQERLTWGVDQAFQIARLPAAEAITSRVPEKEWHYREVVEPRCLLWVAGAGHIAQAVAPLATQLDFAVTVFDDRPALLNHEIFRREVALQSDTWEKLLQQPLPAGPGFALIVTRGHRHDALVLRQWIHQPFLFIGMIGSTRKARIIFDTFQAERLATPEELSRVACPVGIRIRSTTVAEIAVSIMAQFIEKRAELASAAPPGPRERGGTEPAAQSAGQGI